MLFRSGYVGDHLYDGDLPHAERRASLLSLDPALLGELLGSADMAELLDADVVCMVQAQLQRVAPDRRVRGVEGVADLLRALGPLSVKEVAARMQADEGAGEEGVPEGAAPDADAEDPGQTAGPASLQEAEAALAALHEAHRAFPTHIGGDAVSYTHLVWSWDGSAAARTGRYRSARPSRGASRPPGRRLRVLGPVA